GAGRRPGGGGGGRGGRETRTDRQGRRPALPPRRPGQEGRAGAEGGGVAGGPEAVREAEGVPAPRHAAAAGGDGEGGRDDPGRRHRRLPAGAAVRLGGFGGRSDAAVRGDGAGQGGAGAGQGDAR